MSAFARKFNNTECMLDTFLRDYFVTSPLIQDKGQKKRKSKEQKKKKD